MTDRQTINEAFAKLRERGIEARGPWTCCATCGRAEMGERDNFLFWHIQADDTAFDNEQALEGYFADEDFDEAGDYVGPEQKLDEMPEGQTLVDTLHLQHDGSGETYRALHELLKETSLEAWWNYDPSRTMTISPPKSEEEEFQEAVQRGKELFGHLQDTTS